MQSRKSYQYYTSWPQELSTSTRSHRPHGEKANSIASQNYIQGCHGPDGSLPRSKAAQLGVTGARAGLSNVDAVDAGAAEVVGAILRAPVRHVVAFSSAKELALNCSDADGSCKI